MPLAPLDNLVRIGQLKSEAATQAELDGLSHSGQAHRKRNLAEYEGATDIDHALLEALIRVALEIAAGIARLGRVPE